MLLRRAFYFKGMVKDAAKIPMVEQCQGGKVARRSKSANRNNVDTGSITKISVRGYKSIAEEFSMEIRPLTILSGANSSGKSSALQPLLLLKQTLETDYDPCSLLINGPNVQFTSAESQLLSKLGNGERAETFCVELEIDGDQCLAEVFGSGSSKGVELVEMTYEAGNEKYTLRPEMSPEEVTTLVPRRLEEFREILMDTLIDDEDEEQNGNDAEEGQEFEWVVRQSKCFLNFGLRFISNDEKRTLPETLPLPGATPGRSFEGYIRDIIHVPGLRGNPSRTYKTTSVGPQFPGTFNNYVASIVNFWDSNEPHLLDKLGQYLETLGLTWKAEANQLDDVQVELRVGRLPHEADNGASDMVSIADVGFGVSQTLPVLVALLAAKPGQLVCLEQPEIHLHPRAQAAMAELLAEASKRGVRVVVETHSDLLLLSLQTLIAEGDLNPEKVKLHWFSRTQDGKTRVSSHDLDKQGSFGNWPEDFSAIKLETESRYLDAVESSQSAN